MEWNLIWILLVLSVFTSISAQDEKFIFYDVNPGEGFNLRRDVFMRIAVFVKKLNQENKGRYTLVLPPWGRLYHWQSQELGYQVKIPWSSFFDVESISRYTPVIDLDEYLKTQSPVIDTVLYLQTYKEGWTSGNFEEKFDFRDCNEHPRYRLDEESGLYDGWFWEYDQMKARDFKCLSVQGTTKVIKDLILGMKERSIFLERGEQLLHDWFGDAEYWSVRRSMRFSQPLVEIANEFRKTHLNSNDIQDGTTLSDKWEDFEPKRGTAKGGPYLCIHLRRKDYVQARKDQIPDIQSAADQIRKKLESQGLETVFVSTDAPDHEFQDLKALLTEFHVLKFNPSQEILHKHKDGGVAIIDQSICSHARVFIGSKESTFTFRIEEEREIMGFETDQTFGMLCPSGQFECEKGSVWKITYPDKRSRNEL